MRVSVTFHFDEINRRLITHENLNNPEEYAPPFACDYDEAKEFVEDAVGEALAVGLENFRVAAADPDIVALPSYHRREIDKLSSLLREVADAVPQPTEQAEEDETEPEEVTPTPEIPPQEDLELEAEQ